MGEGKRCKPWPLHGRSLSFACAQDSGGLAWRTSSRCDALLYRRQEATGEITVAFQVRPACQLLFACHLHASPERTIIR